MDHPSGACVTFRKYHLSFEAMFRRLVIRIPLTGAFLLSVATGRSPDPGPIEHIDELYFYLIGGGIVHFFWAVVMAPVFVPIAVRLQRRTYPEDPRVVCLQSLSAVMGESGILRIPPSRLRKTLCQCGPVGGLVSVHPIRPVGH